MSGNPVGRPNPSPSLDPVQSASLIASLTALSLDPAADAAVRGDAAVQLLRLLAHCPDTVLDTLLDAPGWRLDQAGP